MERIEFEDIYDLAEIMDSYVTSNVSEHEYPIISAYVDYKLAKSLVEILISMGNSIGAILELEDYEMSHYDKEYCVYLTEDGITCEKIFNDGSYYNGGGDISYVHEDCNSKLLSHIDSKTIYEFGYDGEDDCDDCSECACKKDEKPATASSKSVYKVNGKEVSKEEYEKVLDKFSDKYMDSVQDILLNHLEFIDEMRNFAKLFNW